jgi:ferredoxin
VCKEVVGAACYDFMRTGFDTLVTTPLDMSLNTTPCVSCGRCAETCPTGALMPKPRVLEKYDVDESRCILCGICVDACPYDALRCGPDFELSHESRMEPMIDLMAISAMDRDTEISYVRRERDWLQRAEAEGRSIPVGRVLPMLPPGVSGGNGHGGNGNGHVHEPGTSALHAAAQRSDIQGQGATAAGGLGLGDPPAAH